MGAILGVEGARLWWRNETLAVFTLLGGHSEKFGSIYPGFPKKMVLRMVDWLFLSLENGCQFGLMLLHVSGPVDKASFRF